MHHPEASRSCYTGIMGLKAVEQWEEKQGRGVILAVGDPRSALIEMNEMTTADGRFDPRFRERFPSGQDRPGTRNQLGRRSGKAVTKTIVKRCLFCGRVLQPKRAKHSGKTDEHIIAKWLMDYLGIRRL